MIKAFFLSAAVALPTASLANHERGGPLSGTWRCTMNSAAALIEMDVQFNPDGSLYARGTQILIGTSAMQGFEGPGRYLLDTSDPQGPLYRVQVQPNSVPVFSIFVRPTQEPSVLYNLFQNPQTGTTVESQCGRYG